MSQIQKWPKIKSRSDATALRAEGAQADVRSALHSPDHPPFFVFLSFSCFYIYCGSMCSMGSMWAQQSYSAVLHLHLWWYYFSQRDCPAPVRRRQLYRILKTYKLLLWLWKGMRYHAYHNHVRLWNREKTSRTTGHSMCWPLQWSSPRVLTYDTRPGFKHFFCQFLWAHE